jgi:hypothetical protein
MPQLPATWIAHLDEGISYRIGSCTREGEPRLMRAVGARALPDGRLEVLVAREPGRAVLWAIADSGQVALVAGRPATHRTLHVKGQHAELQAAGPEHQPWLDAQREAFVAALQGFGVRRQDLELLLLSLRWADLVVVRFTLSGAWDQTPGPGAGGSIELVPGPAAPAAPSVPPAAHRAAAAAALALGDASPAAPAPSLREMRRLLEGVIPPSMCTVSADGVPHLNYLSHVEYVDEQHVALTYQFLNRSRANVLATGRVALAVECPYTGACITLQLRYRHTETEGPLFERMRARLAGVAAHTGMDKIFRLQGADLYEVQSLRRVDDVVLPPGQLPRCDIATAARSLAQRLGEVGELSQLVPVFMQGLRDLVGVDHAILWLLDEQRQGLYTLASLGYARSGVGSELPLADAGLAGVAIRVGVPIRIGHMTAAYTYGRAWRSRAEGLGLQAVIAPEIPLPGLPAPRSQLAVPLRARGRTVGALLCESERDQFFSYDDEDGLALLGAQLAQALAALQAAEIEAGAPVRPQAALPAAEGPAPLLLRHWPRDHSVFAGDDYLIKGVAGAILWRLACELVQRGRTEFTTRELRLAGGDLGLPEVQDNLGVRLLLLERRLAERDCGLSIERTGRGRFRLATRQPLQLQEQSTG